MSIFPGAFSIISTIRVGAETIIPIRCDEIRDNPSGLTWLLAVTMKPLAGLNA